VLKFIKEFKKIQLLPIIRTSLLLLLRQGFDKIYRNLPNKPVIFFQKIKQKG